jgi:membrane protease YdiL (CAAX protease family)
MDTTVTSAEATRPNLLTRIVRYPLIQALLGAVLVIAALAMVSGAGSLIGVGSGPGFVALAVATAVVIVLAWKAYKRWIERAPDREFVGAGAVAELGAGLAGGAMLFSLMTGVVWLLDGIRFEGLRAVNETQLSYWASIAIISGFMEETLFRGLLFRAVEKVSGSWIALTVTSAIFGFGHIFNPDATWFAALAIAVEAGILLGAAYLLTRRLWLAIGIHAAWNFTQGWVFSIPVSGGTAPIGLIRTIRTGREWLTGGDFGLEASVVAMVVATGMGLVLLYWASRRGRIVPPPWRHGQTKL